ncbi:hypothetical protein, partial [Marilutibacter maris]|uniref:hypothetical protein n=1 Tax=Marilutibacter maris TaxID=1605891 RepID=UPI001B87159C
PAAAGSIQDDRTATGPAQDERAAGEPPVGTARARRRQPAAGLGTRTLTQTADTARLAVTAVA